MYRCCAYRSCLKFALVLFTIVLLPSYPSCPIAPGIFLADIALIPVDWGLALLGMLQLFVAIFVMYALNPVGRKPLLDYGELA